MDNKLTHELKGERLSLVRMMEECRICPRNCGTDRTNGKQGFCRAPDQVILARAALHFWEEPCISGKAGSGAVFFSGCSLGCIYCQNAEISGIRNQLPGLEVSVEKLAEIFLRLQDEEHANNINLVTATHYIPQAAQALVMAKEQGLKIPVIYNCGGYEKVSSLRMLDGLVDVYLPDFKYMSSETAKQYSHAPDYPETVKAAIAEMVHQTGAPRFYPEGEFPSEESLKPSEILKDNSRQLIGRGVIVRHLLLPGHVSEAKAIVSYLHETYGRDIYLSLMNQYTPMPQMAEAPLLGRKTTKREYERLISHALEIGVEYGFIQEGETAKESFIPSWNGEGVR